MTKTELTYLIEHPDKIEKEHLADLQYFIAEYPYVLIFRLLYLKGLHNMQDIRYENELTITSTYVSNRKNLHLLMSSGKPSESASTQQTETNKASEKKKKPPSVLQQDDLSSLYATTINLQSFLQNEDKESATDAPSVKPLKHQHLIDDFIEAGKNSDISISLKKENANDEEPKKAEIQEETKISDNDDFFTETLAKIYIKQHKFENAIRIFKRLSLKYPEKSVYFADQIRFLEKLIQNL